MEKIIILIIIIVLVCLAKAFKQNFLSPALINVYWNAFFIIGAVLVFGLGIEWKYEGIYWTLASNLLFLIGQIIGGYIAVKKNKSRIDRNWNYIYIILIGILILGLCDTLIYIRAFGYSVKNLLNIHELLKLNSEIAYDRYFGHTFHESILNVFLTVVIYTGALIGGYNFSALNKVIGKLLSLTVMIPILFMAIVTNAKVGVIACIFLWAIGWILYLLNWNQTDIIISKKLIVTGIVTAFLGLAFLDLVMMIRIGSINQETQLIVNNKLQEYAFGQVNSFSVWFDNQENQGLDFGSNTYMFLTNWLGFTKRAQGVYDKMPGVVSNIYTQNRGIVMDFGVLGGLVYWLFIGIVSGVVYKKVKSGSNHCIIATVILGAVYFMVLYGFIISPWIYSSYVLAFVGFGIFLVILKVFNFSLKR